VAAEMPDGMEGAAAGGLAVGGMVTVELAVGWGRGVAGGVGAACPELSVKVQPWINRTTPKLT
jgi:hypothetical protein